MPVSGNIICKVSNPPRTGEASYEALLGETMRLTKENRQLMRDNELLRAILAEAAAGNVIVIREEDITTPRRKFKIEENLAGDILITCL